MGFLFCGKARLVAACHRHPAKSRRLIHPQMRKTATPDGVTVFLVEEGGFEPPKAKPADLQSVPFGHLGTLPYKLGGDPAKAQRSGFCGERRCSGTTEVSAEPETRDVQLASTKWSWWTDSNPRPADYKSAALPAELHQHTAPFLNSESHYNRKKGTCQHL